MEDSLKTNFVQKKMWRFWKDDTEHNFDTKMILKILYWKSKWKDDTEPNFDTKWFWKDAIEKVKINIMEDSLKTSFIQKKLWRFWKDDTEPNFDTKTILKRWHWKSKN